MQFRTSQTLVVAALLASACGSPAGTGTVSDNLWGKPQFRDCPIPFVTTCQQPGYMTSSCGRGHVARCTSLLTAESDRLHDLEQTRVSLSPAQWSDGQPDAEFSRTVEAPEETSGSNFTADSNNFSSMQKWLGHLERKNSSTPANLRRMWQSNGQQASYCLEHVYEKYYDISRFQNVVDANPGDARAAFDAAFGSRTDREAIGTRKRLSKTLVGYGTPRRSFGRVYEPRQPKNAFYSPLVRRALVVVRRMAYSGDITISRLARSGLGAVSAPRSETHATMAWHKSINQQLSTVRRAYATDVAGARSVRDLTAIALYGYFDAELEAHQAMQERLVKDADALLFVEACTRGGCSPALQAKAKRIAATIASYVQRGYQHGCFRNQASVCDWAPSMFVKQMKTIERQFDSTWIATNVAERQQQAYESCLSTGHGFSLRVLNNYDWEIPATDTPRYRRGAFHSDTGNNYQAEGLDMIAEFVADRSRYQSRLHQYARVLRERAEAELRGNENLVDESGAIKNPGSAASGGDSMGNRYFGLTYNWSYDWGVNVNQGLCKLSATAGGDFEAKARVLKRERSLIHAYGRAGVKPLEGEGPTEEGQHGLVADVLIGGKSVIPGRKLVRNLEHTTDSTPETYAPAPLEWNSPTVSKTFGFSVGPIPFSVTAGAQGRVGVRYELSAASEGFDNEQDCEANGGFGFGVEAGVTPYARVDGFAEGGPDAGIAKAGIRADLNIINVELPFAASLQTIASDRGELNLGVETNLDLELETLDGKVSAFVQVGVGVFSKRWSKKIVSWNGPQWNENVFNWEYDVDLVKVHSVVGE